MANIPNDVMQVCLNGHMITCSYKKEPKTRKDFCPQCGEKTIIACPNCCEIISGGTWMLVKTGGNYFLNEPERDTEVLYPKTKVDSHCPNCGKPYPWTEKKHEQEKESKRIAEIERTADSAKNPVMILEELLSRFHLFAKQLKGRQRNKPDFEIQDEYDVQDLLHAILKLHFEDIRPEEWTPSYAGSSARMDFLLKDENVVIEVKKTRDTLRDKNVGDQLIIDIDRYKNYSGISNLVCFVYDPDGMISNPRGLENDLSGQREGLSVKVMIVPKGV